jgi:spermidine synthase
VTSIEFILQPGETVRFDVEEVLFTKKSLFQQIEIVRTKTFGKGIFLDRKPQSSEADHFIFNEILVHPALVLQSHPKSVLMIGGGPGSGLAELVKYKSLEEIVICDLDRDAVEAYKSLLPEWHRGSHNDPRVKLHHIDARQYLEELDKQSEKKFDAIYVDIPDPLEGSPSGSLFSEEFYLLLKRRLNKKGIVISQAGRTAINNLRYHAGIRATFEKVFANVFSFDQHIPFYGEPWGFVFASDAHRPGDLSAAEIDTKMSALGVSGCRCYSGDVHHSMFVQPPYFHEAMRALSQVHTDQQPLRVK